MYRKNSTVKALRSGLFVSLSVVVLSLVLTCSVKAQDFSGRKGVPTSGYTQIAPGQYMQTRQYAGYYRMTSSGLRASIKPWKKETASTTQKTGSIRTSLQAKMEQKKSAMKRRASERKNTSTRVRTTHTRNIRR